MSNSKQIFEENGKISEHLQNYEVRSQQICMVEAVEDAINGSQNLIVEAGTGVGKSLAYLVPFINWAVQEDKRVVISTYTKALQNQLYVKDLPFLKRVLDADFRYALCMGSENYICRRKARKNSASDFPDVKKHQKQLEKITKWLSATETGLLTDMDFVPDKTVWNKFSRESDLCLGRKCAYNDECFYIKSRQKQSESHILVTNHFLLFSDLSSGAQVLPNFHGLVLDEAHTLEDIATAHFGKEISNTGFKYLFDGVTTLINKIHGGATEEIGRVKWALEKVQNVSDNFFKEAENIFGEGNISARFAEGIFVIDDLDVSLMEFSRSLEKLSYVLLDMLAKDSEMVEHYEISRVMARKCEEYSEILNFVFGDQNQEYVYWVNIRTRRTNPVFSFHAAPIDISEQMKEFLFEKVSPVVLTSATLSLSGRGQKFEFIKDRLGLIDPLELALDSPFDYENNVLTYMPKGIADPNKEYSRYAEQVQKDIIRIYDIMGGRIFVLFTSYAMLNAVSASIAEEREDIDLLKQGDLPRYVLLDVFKKSRSSILMGTTTFWQGVDVPGKSLECVIITKLPFAVPNDPITSARIDFIRSQGRNPFNEYQIPQAIIMFKQGFGRLIRTHSDRGVVAILDPRIRTRYYGKEFIKALPKCRQTDDIGVVEEFLCVKN